MVARENTQVLLAYVWQYSPCDVDLLDAKLVPDGKDLVEAADEGYEQLQSGHWRKNLADCDKLKTKGIFAIRVNSFAINMQRILKRKFDASAKKTKS